MARSFNGTTDQIATATTTNLGITATASCAIWINPGTLSNAYNSVMYDGSTTAGNVALSILLKSTGKFAYYVSAATGTVFVDPASATASGWTHTGMSYDSTAGLKTYANGVSDGTAAAKGLISNIIGTPFVAWGYDPGTAGRHYPGNMAEAGLWNVVLTADEFAALAKGARVNTIRPAKLIGYWTLDGLSSPEPDYSGLNKNGTLTGTALAAGPPIMLFTPRWPQGLDATAAAFNPYWATGSNVIYEGGNVS